jgi:cation diffusion facilitator family transporter
MKLIDEHRTMIETQEQNIVLKTTYYSIAGNIILALIKWLAGYFGNSYALIADAIESTADIFTSIMVLFGIKYTNLPPDKNHPYGHGRAEPLITFLVVGFLIISAVIIAHESIINIRTPHESPKSFTLYVLAGIIIWKELSFRYVRKNAKKTHSSSLSTEAWHHRSDALTSVAAFIGISIALYLGDGYEAADDWAALFASFLIIYNSYLIFRPALGEIMDEHTYDHLVEAIRTNALLTPGIIGTEKCFIRKAGMKYHVDLHALVSASITVKEGHDIAHALKDGLRHALPQLGHVLIHIEPAQE